jgi:hypothetical protein
MNFFPMMSKWTMIKRFDHNWLIIGASVALSACICIITIKEQQTKKNISAKIFSGSNGWGYDILVDNKLFIRQESIPSLPGKKGFASKQQAEQTAQLIINKMKGGQFPTVTTFEIERIVHQKMQYAQP